MKYFDLNNGTLMYFNNGQKKLRIRYDLSGIDPDNEDKYIAHSVHLEALNSNTTGDSLKLVLSRIAKKLEGVPKKWTPLNYLMQKNYLSYESQFKNLIEDIDEKVPSVDREILAMLLLKGYRPIMLAETFPLDEYVQVIHDR